MCVGVMRGRHAQAMCAGVMRGRCAQALCVHVWVCGCCVRASCVDGQMGKVCE